MDLVQWILLQCFVLMLLITLCNCIDINLLEVIQPNNNGDDDRFGRTVSISGDTIVVGAPREDSNATGVDGDQSNNDATDSGAAYVFVRNGTWTQQAYLKASNTGAVDFFGYYVSISGDTVVVGAYLEDSNATGVDGDQNNNDATDSGAAYVFVREGTTWTQQAYLKASNTGAGDNFGASVSISGDTIVVGSWHEDSNATGVNGDQNDNSASDSGAAYVFVREGTTWTQQAYLKASNAEANDLFGWAVSISGNSIVVGARQEDSNAIRVNGDQNDNSAIDSGAAYVFVREGSTWIQQAYLKASNTKANDLFGWSASISGDTIVLGAHLEDASDSGAAYVFVRNGTTWTQRAYLKASNTGAGDNFGASVSISGDTIVVGANLEDSNAAGVNGDQNNDNAPSSGAAYVFVRSGITWTQQAYLKADRAVDGAFFGYAVGVDGYIVVGQPLNRALTAVFEEVVDTTTTTGTFGTTAQTGIITSTSTIDATESTSDEESTVVVIAVAASLGVLAIVGAVIVLLLFRRKRNNGHNEHSSVRLTLQSKSTLENIKIAELLGSGNFGEWFLVMNTSLNNCRICVSRNLGRNSSCFEATQIC
jgi:hypothetical protein